MRMKKFMALALAAFCLFSVMAIPAEAASKVLELPSPDIFFGTVIRQSNEDNKTAYEFDMEEYNEDLVQRYMDMLVEDYGLKIKKSYRIKDYGDYYHSLTRGYANCMMIYWDNSEDLLTVTLFDKVAVIADDIRYDVITVPDPDEYLKLDAERDYLDMYSPVYHYAVYGKKFPEKKMEKYLQMLELGYDLEPAEIFQEKGEYWREYTVYNADGGECICIWVSDVSGGEYEMSIALYADYCRPESADEWGQQEEPATQNQKKDGIVHMPPPDDFFGYLLDEGHKDNKTGYTYSMCEYDEDLVEDYIDFLMDTYDLKLKHSYRIKDYGDYYHSLTKGYANCIMIYWDKSEQTLTVTFFDKVAKVG